MNLVKCAVFLTYLIFVLILSMCLGQFNFCTTPVRNLIFWLCAYLPPYFFAYEIEAALPRRTWRGEGSHVSPQQSQ